MNTIRFLVLPAWLLLAAFSCPAAAPQVGTNFGVEQKTDRLIITCGGRLVAHYVFRDDQILRPYFAHIHTPGGIQVTRRHPPVANQDATDHDTMHPGLWLGWGNVNGHDFWRNKARIEHIEFTEPPQVRDNALTFAVRNRFVASAETVCEQLCRYRLEQVQAGYLLSFDFEFRALDKDFYLGSQDEAGLGVRVATALTVKSGGTIKDADGRLNEQQVRGSTARWCDYGGRFDGRDVGVTLMPHPANSRPAWYHARDYGFVTANPLERQFDEKAPPSKTWVKPGRPYRLRFGVFIHEGEVDIEAAYKRYAN